MQMNCCVGWETFYDACCVLLHKITFRLTSCQSVINPSGWVKIISSSSTCVSTNVDWRHTLIFSVSKSQNQLNSGWRTSSHCLYVVTWCTGVCCLMMMNWNSSFHLLLIHCLKITCVQLYDDVYQFGFKKKHSTSMACTVLKSVIDYYRSNVHFCMFLGPV